LYDQVVRTAIHSVKPENIATFLGRKLHANYQGELGHNLTTRIQGTRIKHQGFNLSSPDDLKQFEILARGEFKLNGLQNKSLRSLVPETNSAAMTRFLKGLHVHGLIRKVGRTYKYYLTRLDKAVITAGLTIRNMWVIPQLAES